MAGKSVVTRSPSSQLLEEWIETTLKLEGIWDEISELTMKEEPRIAVLLDNILDSIKRIAEYAEDDDNHRDISDLFLYGERIAETDHVYPLKWAVLSDDSHDACVRAIEKTAKEYEPELDEPAEWRIYERDRLNRRYEIKLQVLEPEKLLTLVPDFLKSLERNYEKIK